jgi:hypothetical protein
MSFRNLRAHKRNVHLAEKNYECDVCGAGKIPEIPIQCSLFYFIFNAAFYKRHSIVYHLKIHFGILDETCDICQKTFHTKGSLKYHKVLYLIDN